MAATAESAVTTSTSEVPQFSKSAGAKVIAVVGAGTLSPFDGTSWEDVMLHMVSRDFKRLNLPNCLCLVV